MIGGTAGSTPAVGPLFQERLRSEPFWMLVACQLVNRATWSKAEFIHKSLRSLYPTPLHLAHADVLDVRSMVKALGFERERAPRLLAFARAWALMEADGKMVRTRDDVMSLPGCGDYAADSFEVFVLGRLDVDAGDEKIRGYLERTKRVR